jgi:hypothetical protein
MRRRTTTSRVPTRETRSHLTGRRRIARLLGGLDSSAIDFFVDAQRYFTFVKEQGGDAVWPFDKPQDLILNLPIGGDWGGQKGIGDTAFATQYVIDYVRVY